MAVGRTRREPRAAHARTVWEDRNMQAQFNPWFFSALILSVALIGWCVDAGLRNVADAIRERNSTQVRADESKEGK